MFKIALSRPLPPPMGHPPHRGGHGVRGRRRAIINRPYGCGGGRRGRRERIYPFRVGGRYAECMNAFPTRGGGLVRVFFTAQLREIFSPSGASRQLPRHREPFSEERTLVPRSGHNPRGGADLASLFEGGARRAEGVSCVRWEWLIVRRTPPQSAKLTAPPEGEPRAGD